jgi:hypothetical protein
MGNLGSKQHFNRLLQRDGALVFALPNAGKGGKGIPSSAVDSSRAVPGFISG